MSKKLFGFRILVLISAIYVADGFAMDVPPAVRVSFVFKNAPDFEENLGADQEMFKRDLARILAAQCFDTFGFLRWVADGEDGGGNRIVAKLWLIFEGDEKQPSKIKLHYEGVIEPGFAQEPDLLAKNDIAGKNILTSGIGEKVGTYSPDRSIPGLEESTERTTLMRSEPQFDNRPQSGSLETVLDSGTAEGHPFVSSEEELYDRWDDQPTQNKTKLMDDLIDAIRDRFHNEDFRTSMHRDFLKGIPLHDQVKPLQEEKQFVVPLSFSDLNASDESRLLAVFTAIEGEKQTIVTLKMAPYLKGGGIWFGATLCMIHHFSNGTVILGQPMYWDDRVFEALDHKVKGTLQITMDHYVKMGSSLSQKRLMPHP